MTLTYSRVGTQGNIFAPIDCELVLGRILMGMQVAIQESAAKVAHDPLPKVIGDEVQLGQLFQNLIGNALKYSNAHGPVIHVGCCRRDRDWLLSVRDNGIAIDQRFAENFRYLSATARSRTVSRDRHRFGHMQAHHRTPRRQHMGRIRARQGIDNFISICRRKIRLLSIEFGGALGRAAISPECQSA